MKKVILSFLMIFAAVFMTSQILADETNTGEVENSGPTDLTIHFKNWAEDYTGLGSHAWDAGANYTGKMHDGVDEFGAYFEFEDVDTTVTNAGFIAVLWDESQTGPDWENKQTEDVRIDFTKLVKGAHNHIYIMEGARTDEDNPAYFLAKNDEYNLFLVYSDASQNYEENLGIHAWGGWTYGPGAWGDVDKVFTTGASHTAVKDIKVAMLHSAEVGAGLLIYGGGDDNKKTGDVKLEDALKATYGEDHTPVVGNVGVAYVYNKGDAYTLNDNVHYDLELFLTEAFVFEILGMSVADNGEFTGTYAPNPNQVIVQFNMPIAIADEDGETDLTTDEVTALIKEWVTIKDKAGTEIQIDTADVSAEVVSTFVLILDSTLDNTKEYTIAFEDAIRSAEIALDLDKNGPDIVFLGNNWEGVAVEDRVITVAWDEKFDYNLFPGFIATDDRDGDVTQLVYVPSGDFSTLDTNVVGDYTIMLRVADAWGNVTEEKFIFRVEKK